MTFKSGDMVRLVDGEFHQGWQEINALTPLYLGKVGTIEGFHPHLTHPEQGTWWHVKLSDGEMIHATACCLQLIPGDTEGRKVVDWNWRDLVSKRPEGVTT